mgnify:FL=1
MALFETLLAREYACVERFVRFRIDNQTDADDILQETYLTAYQKFPQLKNMDAFKAWLLSIARNKCTDYFRKNALRREVSLDALGELADSRFGAFAAESVQETFGLLNEKDKQILSLFFWDELSQAEIAEKLSIPIGTVKSRLFTAKRNFKNQYPYVFTEVKGDTTMKKLPDYLPPYTIVSGAQPPFSVRWEELQGWFLVPRLGEKLSWGLYDMPSRKCANIYHTQVTGRARVHGIEGVELTAAEDPRLGGKDTIQRTFVAQLTDTRCRYLATLRTDDGVRNYLTFLDGEEFMLNWGYGADNCGKEVSLSPKGLIQRDGNTITSENGEFLLDIVGRYTVTINGKAYDTVCVMDIESPGCAVITEQFLDQNGRTILWRRYNRDDWALDRYGKLWSAQLPENDRLTVNGITYVHWYDCVTDYIL